MILGVMQPYFYPYLGYFELISRTDKWVVFDIVQYNPKSWMSRNRILHPSKGWQYINVPVQKKERGTLLKETVVIDPPGALSRILSQLDHYKKKAPHYLEVIELIKRGFEEARSRKLVDINVSTLSVICEYLEIQFNWTLCSEMELNFDNIDRAGHWALEISEQLGATEYLNLPGGRELFNPDLWRHRGIKLHILDPISFEYSCMPYNFEQNLSVIDLLMWNTPEKIREVIEVKNN